MVMPPALPTELIRKVIGYSAQENHSVAEIRLVAHKWNDLVDEELSHVSNIPIGEMTITPPIRAPADTALLITVDLTVNNEVALYHLHRYGFKNVEDSSDDKKSTLRMRVLKAEVLEGRANGLFALGRINRIVLRELHEKILTRLARLFHNIQPNEICIKEYYLSPEIGREILQLIRHWNCPKAHLVVLNDSLSSRDFLLDLADCVDVLRIVQYFRFVPGRLQNTACRRDRLIDHSFLVTLPELFTRRVSKIWVQHDNTGLYAEEEYLKELFETVSSIAGKQVWLELDLYYEKYGGAFIGFQALPMMRNIQFSMRMKANDVLLRVAPNGQNCLVSLKHSSRMDEEF